jgi:hypothetical protein
MHVSNSTCLPRDRSRIYKRPQRRRRKKGFLEQLLGNEQIRYQIKASEIQYRQRAEAKRTHCVGLPFLCRAQQVTRIMRF